MNKSLTIVLPVYNAESRLRKNVTELLELASELTNQFGVLIIDDGSTDATFEVAEDLAAHFPQVLVRRHRQRRGLGATIEYVQRRVRTDAVMLHDGRTPVNPQQMRSVWQSWIAHSGAATNAPAASTTAARNVRDLANLPAMHANMAQAHRRLVGFQLITGGSAHDALNAVTLPETPLPRSNSPHLPQPSGVGQIPPLPRPKFLSALAAFALGE